MLLATIVAEELSRIEMPWVPLLLTVTGRATTLPPRSWPARRYPPRVARSPSLALFRTVLLVTNNVALLLTAAPLLLSWMTQLSISSVLSLEASTPLLTLLVAPDTSQRASEAVAPRVALRPWRPPMIVMPFAMTPSITMRRAPSSWMVGRPAFCAVMVAGTTPLVLIVTSSRAMTTFSLQFPLTVITSCFGPAPPPDRASACVIVWPALQLTVTASATKGCAAAKASTTRPIDVGRRRRSDGVRSMLFLLQPAFGGCDRAPWRLRGVVRDQASSPHPVSSKTF